MKRHAIVLAGYYGFGNAGDELILRALVERYRRQEPASPLIVFSADPAATAAAYNVAAVHRWNPLAWIGPMLEAKSFVLGGGGLLQETTGLLNHGFYLSMVALAKFLGCQTETVGLGIDPVKYVFNRFITRFVFNHFVDRIQVRDKGSIRALRVLGVDRTIDCQPDLVGELAVSKPASPGERRIALAFGPWPAHPGWDQDLAVFCTELSRRIGLPMDLIPFFPAQDLPLAEKVRAQAKTTLGLRMWKKPEDLLEWIPEYGLVIGMRFHALVIAQKAGVCAIGWGNHLKVRQFCVEQGAPYWDFDRGWNLDSVVRQVIDAWSRRQSLAADGDAARSRPATSNVLYSTRLH